MPHKYKLVVGNSNYYYIDGKAWISNDNTDQSNQDLFSDIRNQIGTINHEGTMFDIFLVPESHINTNGLNQINVQVQIDESKKDELNIEEIKDTKLYYQCLPSSWEQSVPNTTKTNSGFQMDCKEKCQDKCNDFFNHDELKDFNSGTFKLYGTSKIDQSKVVGRALKKKRTENLETAAKNHNEFSHKNYMIKVFNKINNSDDNNNEFNINREGQQVQISPVILTDKKKSFSSYLKKKSERSKKDNKFLIQAVLYEYARLYETFYNKKIVHKDIKPNNMLIGPSDQTDQDWITFNNDYKTESLADQYVYIFDFPDKNNSPRTYGESTIDIPDPNKSTPNKSDSKINRIKKRLKSVIKFHEEYIEKLELQQNWPDKENRIFLNELLDYDLYAIAYVIYTICKTKTETDSDYQLLIDILKIVYDAFIIDIQKQQIIPKQFPYKLIIKNLNNKYFN